MKTLTSCPASESTATPPSLPVNDWHYVLGKPEACGVIKQQAADFKVIEQLRFAPKGEGEHVFVYIEKQGLNTAFLAEQLAKFCQLPLRNISYAGRKDKYALTQQWFSVHAPGKQQFAWQDFAIEGCRVLQVTRHDKKLKPAALKQNRFELIIRDIDQPDSVESRLPQLHLGVPNYYGNQRFGESRYGDNGGNLKMAEKLLSNEVIRNRNKRSMAISALRSWLFNEMLSARIAQHGFNLLLSGDVLLLSGSNSFFCYDSEQGEDIASRLQQNDIGLSIPLWGQGTLASQAQALAFEQQQAEGQAKVCQTLEQLGLKQERRGLKLLPMDVSWQWQQNQLSLNFALPPGCFATSVLRELIQIQQPAADHLAQDPQPQ